MAIHAHGVESFLPACPRQFASEPQVPIGVSTRVPHSAQEP
jgi:hypothetical protein